MAECLMYREYYVAGEEVIDLGVFQLVLDRTSPELVRISLRSGTSERPLGTLGIPGDRPLIVMPHPPIGGALEIVGLMVRFSYPISVLPGESVAVTQWVPIDLGIYAGSTLVRVVPIKLKYALYGPPDLGDICRYSSEALISDLQDCARTILKLKLRNDSKTVVDATRVVLPVKGLGMYLGSGGVPLANSATMVIQSQNYAEVATELLPSVDIGGVSRLVIEPSIAKYTMRYGL